MYFLNFMFNKTKFYHISYINWYMHFEMYMWLQPSYTFFICEKYSYVCPILPIIHVRHSMWPLGLTGINKIDHNYAKTLILNMSNFLHFLLKVRSNQKANFGWPKLWPKLQQSWYIKKSWTFDTPLLFLQNSFSLYLLPVISLPFYKP